MAAEDSFIHPKFYQDPVFFWENAGIKKLLDLREITSQTVWNNCYILRQRSTFFYPQLCYKGIHYVRDILDDRGKILNTGEKYTKSYYENIMIFKEITIMCFLKIIKIMFFTK